MAGLSEAESVRALIVEDDVEVGEAVAQALRAQRAVVAHCTTGAAALEALRGATYDVVILDLMLPDINGLELLSLMRAAQPSIRILVLSAKRDVDDRVRGLDLGADDYITKPFSAQELVARVQAILRRAVSATEQAVITIGDITLDRHARRVRRAGMTIELHPREFLLLELLLTNPGKVVSKNIVLERVWDYHFAPQTNVVDVLMCRLRSKLDGPFERKVLRTI